MSTIRCRPNGPYVVTGLTTFTNSRGEPIATEENIALCRCGGSANKPFCDGSHRANGFDDAKKPERTEHARPLITPDRVLLIRTSTSCR